MQNLGLRNPQFEKIRETKILNTRILFYQTLAAVCRKIANFCPACIFNHDADGQKYWCSIWFALEVLLKKATVCIWFVMLQYLCFSSRIALFGESL